MATTYKSTASIEVQKQHRCVGCSALFRYPMKRSLSASSTASAAAAEADARKGLAALLLTTFDPHPCPTCGIYQPEMVAKLRSDVVGFISFFAHLAPLVLAGCALGDVIPWHIAAWSSAGSAALALALHYRSATLKPNADLEGNRRKAEHEVGATKLFLDQAGSSTEPLARPGQGELEGGRTRLLALFALGVLALPSAELMRMARGWPLNPKWTPGVIGPGDQSVLYFDQSISSIKGYWAGEGAVAKTMPPAVPATFTASSKSDSWGSTIRAKSSETSTSETPWVRVRFDETPELAGKTLPVRLELSVRYPSKTSAGFQTERRELSADSDVRFAPPKSGETYQWVLWIGFAGGAALLALLGILLVKYRDALGEKSEAMLFAKQG